MPGRGFLLLLDEDEVRALGASTQEGERARWAGERIAGARGVAELDRAWVAIRRCLAAAGDGAGGALARAVLGDDPGEPSDPAAALVPRDTVPAVAAALAAIDEGELRDRFFRTLPAAAQDDSDELDFLYTWQWFARLREAYARAAAEGRAVLFTTRATGPAPAAGRSRADAPGRSGRARRAGGS